MTVFATDSQIILSFNCQFLLLVHEELTRHLHKTSAETQICHQRSILTSSPGSLSKIRSKVSLMTFHLAIVSSF